MKYLGSDYNKQSLLKGSRTSANNAKQRKQERVEKYYKDPKRCKECGETIKYEHKRIKKFCNSSCSAKHSNKNRVISSESKFKISVTLKKKKEKKFSNISYGECAECNKVFVNRTAYVRKYCSKKCQLIQAHLKGVKNFNGEKLRMTRKYGKFYFCKELSGQVYLDSSWEVKYAEWLDKNNIKWIRPKYLVWIDIMGLKHRYTADFYLTETKEYIDIKNNYLLGLESTRIKLEAVEKQNNIKVTLLSREMLKEIKVI